MATDNGYSFSSSSDVIEYEFINPKQLFPVLLFFVGFVVIGGINFWMDIRSGGVDLVEILPAGIFAFFFLLGPAVMVYALKKGVRSLRIDGNTVTLNYPDEMVQLSGSQMLNLKVRERKDDGKIKGKVRFTTSDERKFALSFILGKKEGRAAYEWFKAIADKQEANTYGGY